MNWWVSQVWSYNPVLFVSIVLWVVLSITLHELSHGLAALRCGDTTPRDLGHMTFNPLVHIPTMSWVMFALMGCCYGLMPINPSRFRGRYDDAFVAAAGPFMNLLLACVATALFVAWKHLAAGKVEPHVFVNVGLLIGTGVGMNLFLMLFNLVPIPPLDGSKILETFVPAYGRIWRSEQAALIAIGSLLLLYTVIGKGVWSLSDKMGDALISTVDTWFAPVLSRGGTP